MIEPITPEHIAQVVGNLRNERALDADYISWVVGQSLISCAGTKNGKVVILFGVQADSFYADIAYMWMLATPLIEDHKMEFLRQARQWVKAVPFRRIYCMVYKDYLTSIRWLEWMKFAKVTERDYLDWGRVNVMELVQWQ